MSTIFERCMLGPAPALIARPQNSTGPLPTILWFHGFTADKEINRLELEQFARAGFLAVGIDAVGHGERRNSEIDHPGAGPTGDARQVFHRLVEQTVREVPQIVDALRHLALSDHRRLGAVGVSMGGYITYGAIAAEPRLLAAVALLGSPQSPGSGSAHRSPNLFFPTALLSVTAERDDVVPPGPARALHGALTPVYADQPERLRYREVKGAGHIMDQQDWDAVIQEAVSWMVRFVADAHR